ncbi:MAG: protein kinase [Planctomycetota bacterium]
MLSPFGPGSTIDGRYRVEGALGAGGMGDVLRATDLARGLPVALKLLPLELAEDPALFARFRREAELAARVDSGGGVARVHDLGQWGGRPYVVMELLPGGDLEAALAAGLTRERLLAVVEEMAAALARCHAQGVVHRDVKPQNVLLDEEGRPRLTDFGIALDLDAEQRLTLSAELLGTPSYMAPEQATRARDAGPPADVYGLGAILYRGLCGRPPFEGSAVQVLSALVEQDPPPPSRFAEVSPDLERLVLAAMSRDPTRRPSAAALAEDLGRLRRGEALARPRSRLGLGAVLALALLALGGALVGGAWALRRSGAAARRDLREIPAEALIGLAPLTSAQERALAAAVADSALPAELAPRVAAWSRWRAFRAGAAAPPSEPLEGALGALAEARILAARCEAAPSSAEAERLAREAERAARRALGEEPDLARAVGQEVLRARFLAGVQRACEARSPEAISGALALPERLVADFGAPDPASWVGAKRELLARLSPVWAARLRRVRSGPPDPAQAELGLLAAVLGEPAPVTPPPPLRAALRAWLEEWVRWAGSEPERIVQVAGLATSIADLDIEAWVDPPTLRAALVSLPTSQPVTVPALLTIMRTRAEHPWRRVEVVALRYAPQKELAALAERRPESRALGYWALLAAKQEALTRRTPADFQRWDELADRAAYAPRPDLDQDLRARALLERARCLSDGIAVRAASFARLKESLDRALALASRDARTIREILSVHLMFLDPARDAAAQVREHLAEGRRRLEALEAGCAEEERLSVQLERAHLAADAAESATGRASLPALAEAIARETLDDPAFAADRMGVTGDASYYNLWARLIEALLAQHKTAEALQAARQAPQVGVRVTSSLGQMRARALHDAGLQEEARDALREARAAFPEDQRLIELERSWQRE